MIDWIHADRTSHDLMKILLILLRIPIIKKIGHDEYIGPNQIFGFNDPGKPDGLDIKRWIPDDDPQFDDIFPEISLLISEKISHIKLSESGDLE